MSLIEAIRRDDLAGAAACLRAGAPVNAIAPGSLSPLMLAAGRGHAGMVELLLRAGADVHAIEPRAGAAALHKAALSGNPAVVELLLDHGAFIDQQTPIVGHTALMEAVIYKREDVVRLLLGRGARTSIRNHWQETARDIALRDGLDGIAALIAAREEADRAAVRAHALAAAVKAGDLGEVERLIAAGADVDRPLPLTGSVDDAYTPLAIAARDGHAAIVQALLDAGADPRRIVGLYCGTALHEASYFGHAGIVERMTDDRLPPAQRPALDLQGAYNGFTALHDAAWHGHLDAARALVRAGHPLRLRDHAGQTARDLAQRYGYGALARFLQDAEAARRAPQPSQFTEPGVDR